MHNLPSDIATVEFKIRHLVTLLLRNSFHHIQKANGAKTTTTEALVGGGQMQSVTLHTWLNRPESHKLLLPIYVCMCVIPYNNCCWCINIYTYVSSILYLLHLPCLTCK